MIFSYQEEKQFEEAFNCQHYPFLIEFFSRRYSSVTIEEVTDIDQQMRGIDIKICSSDDAVLKCELKNDKHINSPNIFLEDISNSVSGTPGWTIKCESDILSYGFCNPKTKKLVKLYIYDMQLLRTWYQRHKKNYPLCRIPNATYDTYGRPVPRKDIEEFLLFKIEL